MRPSVSSRVRQITPLPLTPPRPEMKTSLVELDFIFEQDGLIPPPGNLEMDSCHGDLRRCYYG